MTDSGPDRGADSGPDRGADSGPDRGADSGPDARRTPEPAERAKVIRNGLAIGAATATYGVSFGALAVAAGLSVAQTCALSLLMFTGASQFAFVGVLAAGGGGLAAATTAALLGTRNALYGLHLSSVLGLRRARRTVAAQFVIDESAAMALANPQRRLARVGFWVTGLACFVCWNSSTLLGALGAQLLSDPKVFGLDAVAPAAFAALVSPRMRSRPTWLAAIAAATVALAAVPLTPAGIPVLVAAVAVGAAVLWVARGATS